MERSYKIKNLGCAHCASKMEAKIKKLPGVKGAVVNFMTQKLVLEADESDLPELARSAKAICEKIEPECELVL